MRSGSSAMDDSEGMVIFLDSENEQKFDGYRDESARLFIRCEERETNVILRVDAFINTNPISVRYRLGEGKARTATWSNSTDYKALFAPSPISFARQLTKVDQLIVRFTPYGDNPVEFIFDVRGLADYLGDVAKACGWNP